MVKKGREVWPSRKLTSIQASGKIGQHFRRDMEICDPPGSGGRVHPRGRPEKSLQKDLEEEYQNLDLTKKINEILSF